MEKMEKNLKMDPTLKNFPILSYVMEKIPSFKRINTNNNTDDHDIENPPPTPPTPSHPHFELYEQMPHLKNPKLLSSMRNAVSDVSKTRAVIRTLGTRPDHETVDTARTRVAEIEAREIKDSGDVEDYKVYKAAITLEEMHAEYEKMLGDAERRLERIYEAAIHGDEIVEEKSDVVEEGVNEDVVRVLKETESGKVVKKVELSGKGVRSFPEAFGKLKCVVVMNLSNNRLQVIPDSVAGLENLEELNLSSNSLESLPDSIGLLFKLKILSVSKNKLAALPDSISHCRSLVELDASFNKLTYLPTNIGFELVNLQKLSIHLNKIRSLPTSIGEMKSMRLLDVHFNELHGLPQSIGKLKNLETLNLGSNFSDLAELPDTFSDLTNLKELDLSNNQIHALPDAFWQLVNLNKLNVTENPLEIPPKEIVSGGVEAIRAFMNKRQEEIHMKKQSNNNVVEAPAAQDSLLSRSTSWLSNVASNVSETVSGMGSPKKSNADKYLNQQF